MDMAIEKTVHDGLALLKIGNESNKAYLFIHGYMGSKEEAIDFANSASQAGYQVLAMDLPEHGERRNEAEKLLPWVVIPEIQKAYTFMREKYHAIRLRATSLGAWLSMLALQHERPEKALFVSPVIDMEALIQHRMRSAGVTESELEKRGEIQTDRGEALSWPYLCYVREHPVNWSVPTEILYAVKDNITSCQAMKAFASRPGRRLTIVKDGDHWFHTEEQLRFLHQWEKIHL
jgi:alpha-beta hydrolase superfamily lysophospholipase